MGARSYILFIALLATLSACQAAPKNSNSGQPLEAIVNSDTLDKKFLVGYQGWFSAQGDGSSFNSYFHWTRDHGLPSPGNVSVDLWPDLSEFTSEELFNTALLQRDSKPAKVFSSYHPRTVDRHFKWMKDYGLDGVMLQRFLSDLATPKLYEFRNQVLRNVMAGAQRHGRVFTVMYDITGANPKTLEEDLKKDWKFLVDQIGVLRSERYLKHRSKPLLAIWGFGFKNRPFTPDQAERLIRWFTKDAPPSYQVTLMGGVPAYWRSHVGDVDPKQDWSKVFRSFQVLSPWMVGRLSKPEHVEEFATHLVSPDIAVTGSLGIDYMPVVFPGFSWGNLKQVSQDAIPRLGGEFYWKQISKYLKSGAQMIYGAMFDELDEGTALLKLETHLQKLPEKPRFANETQKIPGDHYLKITGYGTRALKGGALNLDDPQF